MENKIEIILDSVSCVDETELIKDPRVHVVRLVTVLGNEEWYDGEKSPEEMVGIIQRLGVLPKTSQPAIGELLSLFNSLTDEGKKAIFLTLDSGVSGTYQTAAMAAKQLQQERPEADIRVIDSRTAALPIAAMARELLAKITAGCEDMDELEAYGRDLVQRTRTYFTVDTLEYLQKGGRIGKASALLGSILGIRPILSLDDEGKVIPIDKCRSRKKALHRVMEIANEEGPIEAIYVCGCFCEQDMQLVAEKMREAHPGVPCESSGIGTVLLSHLGPGILGLFVRVKK